DDAGSEMFHLDDGQLADQTAVDKTLSALEFATPERRLEANQDRRALGLDAPRTVVTLAMGAIHYRIALGAAAPAPAGAVYASAQGEGLDGEPVFVLSRDLFTELSRPRETYRSRTLVPYLSSQLATIALEASGEHCELSRGAWGGWAVDFRGSKVRVDRDAFD